MNKLTLEIWRQALVSMSPAALLEDRRISVAPDEGLLFWGKAARSTAEAVGLRFPAHHGPMYQVRGEHPFPGAASFRAGGELLDFFAALERLGTRRLTVFLSGGASSQAWLRPANLSADSLLRQLRNLYTAPLGIAELNRRRSGLCALKSGGAARWLARLAPAVRTRVWALSDVAPYGLEVVGSGPFWNGEIPHRMLADNGSLLAALAGVGRDRGFSVRAARSGCLAPWQEWVRTLSRQASDFNRRKDLLLLGGEPRIALAAGGRGGRQTQVAVGLALALHAELLAGELEILCGASDGVDGRSRAAGALLDQKVAHRLALDTRAGRTRLTAALRRFDAATGLARAGALLPEQESGTNLQDAVVIARV